MRVLLLAARPAALLVLAAAIADSGRLAWADLRFSLGTREAAEAAARIDPGNAAYALAVAAWRDANREDPLPELRRASRIAPLDERVIQRLALALELAGDPAAAEREFLRAADRSSKYDPRWALANFYFRHGDATNFRKWTREALAMSYSDPAPLFDLAWAMSPDAGLPLEDLPSRRDVRLAYGNYLAAKRRTGLAARVASTLDAGSEPQARILAEALAADHRLAEAERIAPGHATRWTSDRAHWSDNAWRITLDGNQPEQVTLLSKLARVEAGPRRLTWSMSASLSSPAGRPVTSGLRWRVSRWSSSANGIIAESEEVDANGESGGSLDFIAPAGGSVRISLDYRRPAGSMRAEGSLAVMTAGIEP